VTVPSTSQQSLVERELELALREAELNRREATLRRAEEAHGNPFPAEVALERGGDLETELAERLDMVERRERELQRMVEAVDAQRLRLEEVRAEYEERRDALTRRTREVEEELALIREERARLEAGALEPADAAEPESEEPLLAATLAALDAVPAEPVKPSLDAFTAPEARAPRSKIDEWWAKQLGSPLEAA
jgi:chromosome segregation ATPase